MPVTIEPFPLLIRADAGGHLGTGHIMRMIALAQAWQDRGGSVTLAACQCPPPLIIRLKEEHIDYAILGDLPLGGEQELAATIKLGTVLGVGWIVIDGYHFTENYQKGIKIRGFKVLAVDDYGHCKNWHADIVLNQNLQGNAELPARETPQGTRFLTGPKYAMLRREFYQDRRHNPLPSETARIKLLVTFGGVDPAQAALKVLRALNACPSLDLDLRILAGPANPHHEALSEEVARSPHHSELIPACDDMPTLYSWADRVISAGGSSCYEWMLFGIPGWVTSVAANQDAIVRAMLDQRRAAGVPRITEISPQELVHSLTNWLSQPSLSPRPDNLVDGYGAMRVAAAISSISCWVRPVNPEIDARFLFTLANEPSVRSAGRHTSTIQWDEHLAWLQHHCDSRESYLMMIEMLDHGPIGQVRFHHRGNQGWEIGISISPQKRRSGLGIVALTQAMRFLTRIVRVSIWIAEIRDENMASQRLFEKMRFTHTGTTAGMQTWQLSETKEMPSES